MPYKIEGSTVMHKKGGKWSKKATASSSASAKKMVNLLHGVEHGWKPTGKPARNKVVKRLKERAEE